MQEEQDAPNYYQNDVSGDSLRYRLDASDIISQATDTLRGGVIQEVNGVKYFNTSQALMNELGVSKARMVLESCVNKVSHLTKFSDEDRVFRQVKSVTKTWIYELALNMKIWSPNAKYVDGVLVNPKGDKVRNKHLVVAIVENAILQSMLRGTSGFEAELTGKQMILTEHRDMSSQGQDNEMSGRSGWFGGRK